MPGLQAHSPAMGQKDGVLEERRSQKWTAAVDLQPALPKSDRRLGLFLPVDALEIIAVQHVVVAPALVELTPAHAAAIELQRVFF